MKKIFAHIIRCAADKFEKRLGTFELMGCDIMIDTNLKVLLIEMNTNPALFLGNFYLLKLIRYCNIIFVLYK